MKITPRMLEIAILDIFSQYGVYAGGRLSLRDMEEGWANTGLRRGDLVDGLTRLINAGALRLENEEDGVVLELTARGNERHAGGTQGFREIWEESRSYALLRRARLRHREFSPGTGRRRFDAHV